MIRKSMLISCLFLGSAIALTAGCSNNGQADGAPGGLKTQAQVQQSNQQNAAAMETFAKMHQKPGQ